MCWPKLAALKSADLAGLIIGAASRRVPVVVDGFISTAAALLAVELVPDVRPYLIAAHRSVEIGQRAMLEKIGIEPLMDLNLRLGEGTGAVLAFNLMEASVRILNEMATFRRCWSNQSNNEIPAPGFFPADHPAVGF